MRIVNNVLAFYTHRDFPSNHYAVEFRIKHLLFRGMEYYLMFSKAMLFNDPATAIQILQANHPQQAKLLGRQVAGFQETIWADRRESIYFSGLKARYDQNPDDKLRLLETFPLVLAEAAPRDRIWGTGLAESDDAIGDPANWTGQNLCGSTQQRLREFYRQAALV